MGKLQKEIIVLKQCQISGMRISKLFKVPKSTVFDAIKHFEELGDYSNHSGRGQKNLYTPKIDKKSVFKEKNKAFEKYLQKHFTSRLRLTKLGINIAKSC